MIPGGLKSWYEMIGEILQDGLEWANFRRRPVWQWPFVMLWLLLDVPTLLCGILFPLMPFVILAAILTAVVYGLIHRS